MLEQALNPDTMRNFGSIWDGQFWFRLVRVGEDSGPKVPWEIWRGQSGQRDLQRLFAGKPRGPDII
jgi:hypothetical protein